MADQVTWRQRLARLIAGPAPKSAQRLYAGARTSHLTSGFGVSGNSSADAELASSLLQLRARSRQMMRDNPYAKRARTLVMNNVVGSGVKLQAQVMTTRGDLATRVNDEIEELHREWSAADQCHVGGALHLCDMERIALGEVFEAGEVLIRKRFERFGESRVPLALELIEPERLAGEFDAVTIPAARNGNQVRLGVEIDRFHRAQAYYLRTRHPGDLRIGGGPADELERVPADEIFHLRLIDRWPQTRGEPWLHTVLRKLDNMNEYSDSEVAAARFSSYYFATSKTDAPDMQAPISNDTDPGTVDIHPGQIHVLPPGEELTFHTPNRPNTAIDPFLRYMLREVAAGVGPSYESLSRDYSQSNYSSSRLALLDDRDLWRVLQQWWVRSFRMPLYRLWLQQAVLAGALDSVPIEQYAPARKKFEAVLFKPRGWSWVAPDKEIGSRKEAIKGGLDTISNVLAETGNGMDLEDFIAVRQRELQMLADAGIEVDTTVTEPSAPTGTPPPTAEDAADGDEPPAQPNGPPARLVSFGR